MYNNYYENVFIKTKTNVPRASRINDKTNSRRIFILRPNVLFCLGFRVSQHTHLVCTRFDGLHSRVKIIVTRSRQNLVSATQRYGHPVKDIHL